MLIICGHSHYGQVFWKARNEIQCCTPGSDIPRLAVSSTPQEWEKTGRALFTNKRYIQAMHCFERAGLDREAAVAHAYFLREQARATARHDSSKQVVIQYRKALCAAADAFLKSAESAINSKERIIFLRNAGECLEKADEDVRAAEAYKKAQEYTKAAKLYRKAAQFDQAVAVVTENRSQVAEDVAESIIGVAKLFYFQSGKLE
jgi:tetratricopeptide (TPR) repeat protein